MPLLKHGTEAQKSKYLRRLGRGEIIGAFCLTEPQAGSDAAAIQTRATRNGDDYLLNGTKIWVSNGGYSGVYVVFAKTDPARGRSRRYGISRRASISRAFASAATRIRWACVFRALRKLFSRIAACPAENRLGEEGQGLKIALDALDGGRVGIAAQSVGVAQGAMEAAVKYAKQRQTFGKPIAEYQAIQWMLADMQTEIEAARALTHYAAWMRDAGAPRLGPHASRAKLYASEMANRVCAKAVQVHGSVGYSRETDVERYYRDARVLTIYEGTSEMQRIMIARDSAALAERSESNITTDQGCASSQGNGEKACAQRHAAHRAGFTSAIISARSRTG